MHLTDEQLNEYLDHESKDRWQVEAHIAACVDCAARLAALRSLFGEIESLPEVALPHDLTALVTRRVSGRAALPRLLQLTAILQLTAAMIVSIFAAPFVTRSLSLYLSGFQMPSPVSLMLQIQVQWTIWLGTLTQLQLPDIPHIPAFGVSSLAVVFVVAGVAVLWLLGNGLLLKDRINLTSKEGERYG